MLIRKITLALVTAYLLLLTANAFSKEYRNSGFIKPMNLPFNLAGSFGEPRKDHFHSGIDIKTNGVEGETVFAIGDGYISRIRVSPYGYGRAIYITHNNGFVSVYGHLSQFYGAIEKYIHAQHYAQQKSELDIYLDANKLPIKQGDTIAFSGNTGGSSAPHLHFEIRDAKTEHALNALDFYPKNFYADTIPPQLNKVKILSFYDNSYFSTSNIYDLKEKENYITNADTIIIDNYPMYSISLEGFDKQDNSENKNGIKKIEVFQGNNLVFKYDLTEIDFDKTRMCNAFVDYDEMMNETGYYYNCYRLKGNTLTMYPSDIIGNLKIKNNENQQVNIYCYDYNDNIKIIKLNISRQDANKQLDSTVISSISSLENSELYKNNFKINFEKNTFYDDCSINIIYEKNIDKEILEGKYKVENFNQVNLPLQKAAKISFNSTIKNNRDKINIIRQDNKEKETALKTTFDKTTFYADTKELGTFYLKYDTTKPEIKILNLDTEILNQNIQAKIIDNLSGINTYNSYIDDKWVNFYYDAKNDLIQYNFDEYCTKGEHTLKIVVTDNVGNKNILEQKFNY